MSEEKVSVIITTYKRAIHLERAIKSVQNQDYKNIELIVVDDNDEFSKYRKNVEKIMEQYKTIKNIKYIKHKKNKNGSAARNTGIKESRGKYIAFLDDDDIFCNERIKKLVNELEKKENSMYGAIYSNVEIIYDEKNEFLNEISICGDGNFKKELLMEKFTIGTGSNLFVRRSIVKKLNGFDERFKRHQDWEFLIRMFRITNIKYYDEILVKKLMDSRINYPNSEILQEVKNLYLEEFNIDIKEYGKDIQKEIINIHMKELIKSYLNEAKFKKARGIKEKYNISISLNEYRILFLIYLKGIAKIFIRGKKVWKN